MDVNKMKFDKRAFTLIELLVVISIIALLMAIMMPALGRARENAKATICQSNNRNIAQAVAIYANQNDDRVPPSRPGHPVSGPKHPWSDKYPVHWQFLVLNAAGVLDTARYDELYEDEEFKQKSFITCPSWRPPEESEASVWGYGMNMQLFQYDRRTRKQLDPSGTYTLDHTNYLKAPKVQNIPQPSTVAYSGESPHHFFGISSISWLTNKDEFMLALQDHSYPRPANTNIKWNDVRNIYWSLSDPYRHLGSASYSFIDGHAERLKATQETYDFFKKNW